MFLITILILNLIVVFLFFIRIKNIHIWFFSYCIQTLRRNKKIHNKEKIHIMFCVVDHFEPPWNKADYDLEERRVNTWVNEYPQFASKHKDYDNKYPQHTFFFAAEEYRREHIEKIAQLCNQGYGEIEIHLHHDNDTPEGFRHKIEHFKNQLAEHACLSVNKVGQIMYGFIHGNWALNNSRKDKRMCGVNNELIILKDTGCYADFTLPSAPSETQTKKINSIYYACNDPLKSKSHDRGINVEVGKNPIGDLMIIQGPLTLNWNNRKWGIFPRIENGDISKDNPPSQERVDLWIKQRISIKGKPNWIFVKVHTHGCQESNIKVLLGDAMDQMYKYLETKYNDGIKVNLHYVNTRELFNIVKAAEKGENGDPNQYRDYLLEKRKKNEI